MRMLFVNACIRGEESRTLKLCRGFLETAGSLMPDMQLTVHDLTGGAFQPMTLARLQQKERLCDARAWSDPMFEQALEFQQADAVLVGAPYWDLAFPAVLKTWIENMYVRNLTFRYENDRPVGLCRGKEAVYITTSGSPIGENDWGSGYFRAVMRMLGIPGYTRFSLEGLDLTDAAPETMMTDADERIRRLAREWCGKYMYE